VNAGLVFLHTTRPSTLTDAEEWKAGTYTIVAHFVGQGVSQGVQFLGLEM
jgi:hypothetical protein